MPMIAHFSCSPSVHKCAESAIASAAAKLCESVWPLWVWPFLPKYSFTWLRLFYLLFFFFQFVCHFHLLLLSMQESRIHFFSQHCSHDVFLNSTIQLKMDLRMDMQEMMFTSSFCFKVWKVSNKVSKNSWREWYVSPSLLHTVTLFHCFCRCTFLRSHHLNGFFSVLS